MKDVAEVIVATDKQMPIAIQGWEIMETHLECKTHVMVGRNQTKSHMNPKVSSLTNRKDKEISQERTGTIFRKSMIHSLNSLGSTLAQLV